jgi:hypothetical protein
MKEPYDSIRRTQTGKALEEVEAIKNIPPASLSLVKQVIKRRIEYAVLNAAEVKDGE